VAEFVAWWSLLLAALILGCIALIFGCMVIGFIYEFGLLEYQSRKGRGKCS
jgi:hypothetical protein